MHRGQQAACFRVRDPAVLVQHGFERRQEQRERCAQLMADVGEEPALDLVKLGELAVGFFQHLFVLVQFVAEGELPETQAAVNKATGDRDNTR